MCSVIKIKKTQCCSLNTGVLCEFTVYTGEYLLFIKLGVSHIPVIRNAIGLALTERPVP